MAWTWNISSLNRENTQVKAFGQVIFTGNYTAGGDAAGTFNTANGANTAGWPDFKPAGSVLHAELTPVGGQVSGDTSYVGVVVPVAASPVPKIKLVDAATGAEVAAGAYPAAVTASVYTTMELRFRTNL